MARNKEALVLLLDVGPSMHNFLSEIEKLCSRLVQMKLVFNKTDEVGVVLFGTQDTDNDLAKEIGGYKHLVVLQQLKVVDGDAVQCLDNLPRGTANGDYAIVVGMDMLIKKYGVTNKGKQRLCLITNAMCPVKEPYDNAQDNQVDIISTQMKGHGMKLDCVIIKGNQAEAGIHIMVDENECLLQKFSMKTTTKIVHIGDPTSILGAIKTRRIAPVTIFRGDLEMSTTMKIKISVYKKTSEEKLPTLKYFSDKAPPSDKFATHEVKVDYLHKCFDDPDKIMPPEQRIKGYRYGPQVIPISSDEWETVKFKPEKGVKLLGFTDASNILRHHFMKDVNIFLPEPGNQKASIAVSAIARGMKETNKVAIVRCVWRNGQGNVVIGVLTPNISSLDKIPDSLYFNALPFAEDVREFQFPSFSKLPPAYQPSAKQQVAADALVKMLDLAPSSIEESLNPDFTINPVLERYYQFLELKSRKNDAEVPPLDASLERIVEPDPELLSQNQAIIDNFRSLFELKINTKKRRVSGKKEWGNIGTVFNETVYKTLNNAYNELAVSRIGDLDPVKDFETMLEHRDGSESVIKMIGCMKNYISNILESSYEGDTFPKAIECLKSLRKGCIVEQETKQFNQFLCDLHKIYEKTDLCNFLNLIASEGITLINKKEAADSDATEDEAKLFPKKTQFTSSKSAADHAANHL